ncbi:DUF5916 domain-containing protein [Allomuricauda sp. CP2A]|uniref:DUF5916 domain-containing protein n=1 Tax=Allomuricauda sp. CP2A TaxID=1848189 RepID=UPI000835F8AC|nr:DUF5916 domain-containing protein [Muricauda sp. CP2A]
MRKIFLLPVIVSLAPIYDLEAQIIEKKKYMTTSIVHEQSPVIDGNIDEPVWEMVEWGGDFIEYSPEENTPPSFQTKFKVIYDAKYLYFAIRAFDAAPNSIVKRMGRRDTFDGDWVEVNIDSYHDLRTAFSFTATVAGVRGDELISNNGSSWDASWNPIWMTKTQIDDEGWTAEIKIPLSQLRFNGDAEQVWGLQVHRRFFRSEERSVWQRIPQDAPGWVSEFGELHGLKNLIPQNQLEIQPFTVTQLKTYEAEEGNPFMDGSDVRLNGGVDAKIGITNDLTLDLTVNPDFGQVEADPSAIALDGFQIFFREQRPFFVENKNIFDFQFSHASDNLFYSRRIGRNPQGYPNTPENAYVDQPSKTTILGAAKFSGKTKNGWSIGVMESLTAKEFAQIDDNGNRSKELVEPLTNYVVGRLQKDFNNNNSYLGGVVTATNRFDIPESLNFLHTDAYSGGLDFKHQWSNRNYYLTGYSVFSQVKGSPEAIAATQNSLTHLFQRTDAGHVSVDSTRTSLVGTGGKLEYGKVGGGNLRYTIGAFWKSPELEINDIGFLRQTDEFRQYNTVAYQSTRQMGNFRRIGASFSYFNSFDFDGNRNRTQYQFGADATFLNNWSFDIGGGHIPANYRNAWLQGGPRFRLSRENFVWFIANTDLRKKLRFSADVLYSEGKQSHFTIMEFTGGITYQPSNALTVSLSPQFARYPNKTQYVTETDFNGVPRYITSEIDNKSLSAAFRINYTINPNLTIQYYGQPFIARGRYTKFNYITNPTADNLFDRYRLLNENQITMQQDSGIYQVDENLDGNVDYGFDNPDFSLVEFRSNLVLRWEYIPGSELFLVWSQGISNFMDPASSLTRGLESGIFGQKPENIFLMKLTYRLVL